jgi:erythromycin esterase-like protein
MLESEIKKLTDAVQALTAQLAATHTAPAASVKAATEQADTTETPAPSVDALQEQAMGKVREDRKNKTAIKNLIASYGGAKIIAEIPAADLPEFADKLGAI